MVYVRNKFPTSQVTDVNLDDSIESLWVDIRTNTNSTVRIGAFYRPPSQTPEKDKAMIDEVERGCTRQTVILGDFNLSAVNWETMVGDACGNRFIESFQDNYLVQVVDKPTRGTKLLDLVLTNIEHCVRDMEVGETLGNSDHNIVRFNIVMNRERSVNKTKVPNYKKGDYKRLRQLLGEINWEESFRDKSAHDMWDIFKNLLEKIVGQCIPFRAIRKGKRKPLWWTQEIGKKIGEKKKAFSKFKSSEEEIDLIRYRRVRDELNRIIKKK